MKGTVFSAIIVLLIVSFLGASIMTITPIEDADAWPLHICCREVKIHYKDGRWEIIIDCDPPETHAHFGPCSFECPTSS